MATKKLLSDILNERSESVKYRKIRSELFKCAQNNKNEFLVATKNIDDYAITRFKNEGITVREVVEFGYNKIMLKW